MTQRYTLDPAMPVLLRPDGREFVDTMRQLVDANVVSARQPGDRGRSASIRIHGRGPTSPPTGRTWDQAPLKGG
jgi:hypothetical protein